MNKNNKNIAIGFGVIIITLLVILIILVVNLLNQNKEANDTLKNTPDQSQSTNDNEISEKVRKIAGKEKEDTLRLIKDAIDIFHSNNVLLDVQNGEDTYTTLVYNQYGEAISQESDTGYISVYFNDGNCVTFTDYVEYGHESDAISLIESSVKLVDDGAAELYLETDKGLLNDGFTRINLDIRGWNNITKLYNNIDKSFAEEMVAQLKSNLSLMVDSGIDGIDVDKINFRMVFIIEDEQTRLASTACCIYFGDIDSEMISVSEMQASWLFEGYHIIPEWKLQEDWYSLDWGTLADWTEDQLTEVEKLLVADYSAVDAMLTEHFNLDEEVNNSDSNTESEDSDDIEENKDSESDGMESTEDLKDSKGNE